jgi:phenylacetate-CoA ligase
MEQLRKRIHAELKSELGISAHIKLCEPRSIPRSEGKAKRIIDKRSI